MSANCVARGYMIKRMNDLFKFTEHVVNCIEKQFLEFDDRASISLSYMEQEIILSGILFDKEWCIELDEESVKSLKEKGPYALDKRILDLIKCQGIHFDNETHYLKTVNIFSL